MGNDSSTVSFQTQQPRRHKDVLSSYGSLVPSSHLLCGQIRIYLENQSVT